MIDGKRVLVIVPARGGSKGIPLKNLAKVCGETLIWHTAQIVKALDFVDRAVVSTDHPAIAQVACDVGFVFPFWRPRELSGDMVSDFQVLHHALTTMEKLYQESCDVVVMLQPTCPLRTVKHVTQTVQKLIEGFDSVWTVSPVPLKYHSAKQLRVTDGSLTYDSSYGKEIIARQQLTQTYYRTGACYAFTRECLLVQQTIMGKRSAAVVIDEPLVNIDTPEDLAEAERLMRARVD